MEQIDYSKSNYYILFYNQKVVHFLFTNDIYC